METWEYLEVRIYPDEHYYTRRLFSRQRPNPLLELPDIINYPPHVDFAKIDVGKIAAAQGWQVVAQAPNRGYLFKRRLGDQPTKSD